MDQKIVCDLTELTTIESGKVRFYGIARTVAEIAKEMVLERYDVRFVVHSADFDSFFEIQPVLTGNVADPVDLCVPIFRVIRFRRTFHRKRPEEHLVRILGPIVSLLNRRKIKRTGFRTIPIDLNGARMFSAARPKLMVEMVRTIKRQNINLTFHPLIHDLIPLHDLGGHSVKSFPINFFFDSKYIIENCDQIITNSHFTLDDLVRFANDGRFILPDSLVPVPLVHECPEGTEEPQIELPTSPYFLCVGSLMGRKNLNVLLDSFLLLERRQREMPKLIVAGAFRKHIARALKSKTYARIAPHIEQFDSPSQTDLIRLYQNAVALLMPSKIEGWGLPAGEALWLGVPAICSTAPVLFEVCGDLALYFDPDNPEELFAHMINLLDDPKFREDLRQKIIAAKPRLRTWAHVANNVYDAVAEYSSSLGHKV